MLIFGTPANSPYDEKFYQNFKLHEVVSGNLFDGDLNYNFVGFVDEIMVSLFIIQNHFCAFLLKLFWIANINFFSTYRNVDINLAYSEGIVLINEIFRCFCTVRMKL